MYCPIVSVLKYLLCVELVMSNSAKKVLHPTRHSGVYTFEDLATADLLVDKSMMIQEFINSKCQVNVVTRPRKWGKSVTVDMLKTFFEPEVNEVGIHKTILLRRNHIFFKGGEIILPDNSSKVLKQLKIANVSSAMKYFGVPPVLLLKLSSVRGKNFQAVENSLTTVLRNAYSNHVYLKEYTKKDSLMLNATEKEQLARYFSNKKLTTQELEGGIIHLSSMLYRHFLRKVIIIVDDKDAPLNNAIDSFGENNKDITNLIALLQNLFDGVTNNKYTKKCFITGTLPFSGDSLFRNASNVCVRSVLDTEYSDYFGFTEEEVDCLLDKAMPNRSSVEKMKYWYKGFNYGGKMLYNPLDIMGYVSNGGKILDYWADSGRVKALDAFFILDEAQEDLQKLLEDEGTVKSLSRYESVNPNEKEVGVHTYYGIFFRLMVYHGYLNAFKIESRNDYLLRIPNQEVRNLLVDYQSQWLCSKYDILINDVYDFVGCLITRQMSQLKNILGRTFENFQNCTLKQEDDYHYFMGLILSRLLNHHFIFSNKHFEVGKPYHMVVPRSKFQGFNAFVIEYAVLGENSNSSLSTTRQLQGLAHKTLVGIDSNVYGPILANYNYIINIVTVAIAFKNTTLELAYKLFKQE